MSTIQQCCISIVVDILGRSEKRLRQDQKRGGTLDLNVMYKCHYEACYSYRPKPIMAKMKISFEGSFSRSFLIIIHTNWLKVQYYAISKAPFPLFPCDVSHENEYKLNENESASETHFYLNGFTERPISVISLCKVI